MQLVRFDQLLEVYIIIGQSMLITSSEPIVLEAVSDRKSLKNHQEIRRKLAPKKLIVLSFLVIMMIMMIIMTFYQRKQTSIASIQDQEIVRMHEPVENDSSRLATNYFKTYCNQETTDCRKHDEELLNSLIQLISNQKEKHHAINFKQSNNSDLPAELSLPFSIQMGSTSHFKTHKPQQLEWQSYLDQFEQQSLQQTTLSIIKHPKLTTPRPKETGIFDLMLNVFGLNDQYADIDDLVESGNKERSIWSIHGHFAALTVKSNYFISPSVVELISAAEDVETVTLLGLHMGLQREIKAVKLGEFSLKFGINRLYCQSQDCQERYAMVMLLFSKIQLRHISIYQLHRF